jgi:DNA invertase Pin-like site-specific DNA recombinase
VNCPVTVAHLVTIYVDHGLTGTDRNRPGLREAMAVCRDGDTFLVTKLDRLARSVRDAHEIVDELAQRNVRGAAEGLPGKEQQQRPL